jgi:hypothetical protein
VEEVIIWTDSEAVLHGYNELMGLPDLHRTPKSNAVTWGLLRVLKRSQENDIMKYTYRTYEHGYQAALSQVSQRLNGLSQSLLPLHKAV